MKFRRPRHDRYWVERLGILLLSLFSVCLATRAWSQEDANPNPVPSPQPPAAQAPAVSAPEDFTKTAATNPSTVLLKEATPVKLKLLHPLNSKVVVEDDPLNFALAEDLVIDGNTVAKAGAVAIGRVRRAKPARTLGRRAQLSLEMQYLKVGAIRVPLRGTEARAGDNKKGETVTLVVLFGLSGLVKHGSEIEVKEGTVLTAFVDRDTELPS